MHNPKLCGKNIIQAPSLYSEIRNNDVMATKASLVLKNVTLPEGRIADVSLSRGVVSHSGAGQPSDDAINCSGYLVLPAATDMHVHMRGGVQSFKEDWISGSRSALAGGVTLVLDQPNTIPPITTPELLIGRVQEAQMHSACHFAINSGVTAGIDFNKMWHSGAIAFGETFFSPSSFGEAIGEAPLEQALTRIKMLDALATIHAEEIAPVPDLDLRSHDQARSIQGEEQAVLTVNRCNRSGCRVHFCHLSSAASLDAASGSVEVTPHHLFLSLESFEVSSAFGKVNPPLRSEQARKNLWERWDHINVIASDHAPHTIEDKQNNFPDAPAGIPGVETMMPLLVGQVLEKRISVVSVIEKTSVNPATLLGIKKSGFDVGDRADFALYPKIPKPIHADTLHSKCGWTPYENHVAAFPRLVIMGGTIVYRDGEFFAGLPEWFPGRGYHKRSFGKRKEGSDPQTLNI
jgi:dihydroorotase